MRYGTLTAVNDVSFDIREGEIFGLVGPNGSGKTTTLKVLTGLLLPDQGSVEIDGFDVVSRRNDVRKRIGYMADFFGVYDYLTVFEYLEFFAGMYGVPDSMTDERIARVLDTINLASKRAAMVRTLSRGMKQRLYFGRVLVHDPRLLVLDEPASGMDPRGRAEMVDTLKRANRDGRTIIISSHILEELQNLCTSVGIMETSRLVSTQSLHAGIADANRRKVLVLTATADRQRARDLLAGRGDVFSVVVADTGLLVETFDDDAMVAGLLRHLAVHDVRLQMPRADGHDLKEIFLKMTKGELM